MTVLRGISQALAAPSLRSVSPTPVDSIAADECGFSTTAGITGPLSEEEEEIIGPRIGGGRVERRFLKEFPHGAVGVKRGDELSRAQRRRKFLQIVVRR